MTTRRSSDFFKEEFGPMTFGQYLTAVRTNMDLSQSELASRLKISRSMICDIGKGRVLVRPALAVKIAKMGRFPEDLAVKYCLQDQLRKAKINLKVDISVA